jgi:aryl-alcohol dehydrogenase-like predicted oxidoreductase
LIIFKLLLIVGPKVGKSSVYYQTSRVPREKIQLATKFANNFADDGSYSVTGDLEYIQKAFVDSSQRLNVDYIDLYYMHQVDKKTPTEAMGGVISVLVVFLY